MTKAIISPRQQRQAVVLVPLERPVDAKFAREIWRRFHARGYEFVALLRDWPSANRMLGAGEAHVVVMPSVEINPTARCSDDSETVRLPQPPIDSSREQTRDLRAPQRRAAGNSRFVSGRLSREQVRELLDGPGEATGPVGLDPETIAALRRIARRLPPNESPSR